MEDSSIWPNFIYVIKSWADRFGIFEDEQGNDMVETSEEEIKDQEVRRNII